MKVMGKQAERPLPRDSRVQRGSYRLGSGPRDAAMRMERRAGVGTQTASALRLAP